MSVQQVLVTPDYLEDIADAIRAKNGSSDTYKPGQMAAAIAAIPSGGITPTGTVNITENGTVDVTQYASAAVAVPNTYVAGDEGKVVSSGALVAQTARASDITANGTYDTTTNNSVTVNVSGGGSGGRVYIIDPDFLWAAWYNSNSSYKSSVVYNGCMPASWMAYFQNDTVTFNIATNGSQPYIRVSRGNNKVIQFGIKIPASCRTLYLDIAADAGSESYPVSRLNIVDALGITGYYSGNWSGNTLKSFKLTDTTVPDVQEGLTLTRTSARVVPRQVAEIDLSDVSVDSYFTYFGCRSYFDIYGIWAE